MKISLLILLCVVMSCQGNVSIIDKDEHDIYNLNANLTITDAKGFDYSENDSTFILHVKSLSAKYPFYDSLILPKKAVTGSGKYWDSSYQTIACQSVTHLAFLDALESLEKVVAVSELDYMPQDELYKKITDHKVEELSTNGTIDLEHLVSLNPDLLLMYPFEWESDKYQKANVNTLLVSEYLENTPIARLEWVKFFGILLGKADRATQFFNQIKSQYVSLISKQSLNKTAFFNLPFKDSWNMPAANSLSVNLVKDAGFTYLYETESDQRDNLTFANETVWAKVYDADYWIIIANRPANFNLTDLLAESPAYATFKSVKNNQVLFCNTGQTSYFTLGVIEPDVMLKDLLFLTNQMEGHTPKYFYRLK